MSGSCARAEVITVPGLDRPANDFADIFGSGEANERNLTVFSESLGEFDISACQGSNPSRQLVLLQDLRDDTVARNSDQAASACECIIVSESEEHTRR